ADRRLRRPRRGCAGAYPHRGGGDPALVLNPGNPFERSDGVEWASPTGRGLTSEGDAHPTGSPSTTTSGCISRSNVKAIFASPTITLVTSDVHPRHERPPSSLARFGRIDRHIRELTLPLDALLYACHPRLGNGHRTGTPVRLEGQPWIRVATGR